MEAHSLLRRAAIVALAVTSAAALAVPASAADAAGRGDGPGNAAIVRTSHGLVRGTVSDDHRTFQGIPYAAPPVGNLRWRAPQPAEPWPGVRDATRPGSACPQTADPVVGTPASEDEDCLFVNVTTPRTRSPARPRPVLVWVHGGGFRGGAGSTYDERRLAVGGDAVVVTLHYRLGIFGFLGHPELPGSGTFGLQDQQAALRWVRRNIAAFGGDPGNVTVFGQSAGGDGVCALLTSPTAAHLFDRAIMQSGSCTDLNVTRAIVPVFGAEADTWKPLSVLESLGSSVAETLGCTDPTAAIACLRGLDVETLLGVTGPGNLPVYWSPAIGTRVLPVHPAEAVRTGQFNRVPVLAGTTRDEGTYFVLTFFPEFPEEQYEAFLDIAFGDRADDVAARYPLDAYVSPRHAWGAIITDRAFACANLESHRQFATWVPTYGYEFADRDAPPILTFPEPPEFPLGAYHGSEVAYLHDLVGRPVTFTPAQRRLSDRMIRYWTRFAATGDPNQVGQPPWPRIRADAAIPHVQSLAPGKGGIRGVDLSAEHNCDLWSTFQ